MSASSSDVIRVLHVDDEPDFADMAATFVEREDDRFDIEIATSASEGLDLLASDDFDCVVSDYDMPGRNGIEFLEAVRDDYPDLPFILYTGKGSEEVASEAISAGVTDYLQKESGTDQYTILANRITNAVEQARAVQEVTRTRTYFGTILDHASDYVMVVDENAEVSYISPAVKRILGYTPEDLEGTDAFEHIHPEDLAAASTAFTDVLEHPDQEHTVEYRVRHANGSWRWVEVRGRNRLDDSVIEGIIVSVRDITQRKARQQELRQKERRFQAVFNDPNILVGMLDTDGTVLDINETAMGYIDTDVEEITGEPLWDSPWFTGDETVQQEIREWIDQAAAGEYVEFELDLSASVDEELVVSGVFRPVRNDDGEVVSLLISDRDITERKKNEQELEQTNALLSTLIEALPMGVIAEDASQNVLTVNERLFELFEMPGMPEDVIGADYEQLAEEVSEIFVESERFVERINEIHDEPTPVDDEALALTDGRTFERAHRPIELPDSEGHLWVYRDVTDRKTREQEIETMQRRFEAVLENTTTPMFMKDDEGEYIFVNRAYRDLFDLHDEEIVGRTDNEIHPPKMAAEVKQNDQAVIERGEPIETEEQIDVDGDERIFLSSKVPIYDTGDRSDPNTPVAVFGIATDITQRTTREQQLEALNRVSQELMSADAQDEIVEIGIETVRDLLGIDANAIHLYDEDAKGLVPVAATDTVYDLVGEPPTFTGGDSIAWRVYQQGELFVTDDVHEDPDRYNPESPIRSEFLLPVGEYGILLAGSPSPETFNDQDVLLGEILAGALTTALEQVERTDQLRARERELTAQNDRLDEFASFVSHDLRNPLNVAEGRLELAASECDSEHLEHVKQAHERMRTLIEDLLSLAREGETITDVEPVALTPLVEGCWANVETDAATLDITIDRSVQADESRLKQLFENLMRNAIEHCEEDVTVTVGELDRGFYIEDDGPGIPEDERDDVFDAGYSTSEDGTGFGLSIVEQIVKAHDWDIHVTDGDGGGARFEISGVEFAAE